MASFQDLINAVSSLATTMGNALQLRGFKAGGTSGQVPVKGAGGDYDWSWGDVSGIGGGVSTEEMNAAITAAVNGLVAGAPGALDTLNELAAAFGDDANFAATVTSALAGKAPATGISPSAISGTAVVFTDLSDNGAGEAPAKYLTDGGFSAAYVISTGAISGTDAGGATAYTWTISSSGVLTANRVYAAPNQSGTLALTLDITAERAAAATLTNKTISAASNTITGLAPDAIPINTESTTARTLAGSDLNTKIDCTNASGCVIAVPDGIGVSGKPIIFRRSIGAGALSWGTLGGSVTIENSTAISSVPAGGEFALFPTGTNTYKFV